MRWLSMNDQPTPLADAAMQMHELFITLTEQGFTEYQALRLLSVMLTEMMRGVA